MGRILIPKLPGIPVERTTQVNLTVPSYSYLDGIHTKKIPGTIADGLEIIGAGVGYFALGYGNAHPNIILSPNTSVYDHYGGQELIPSQIDWSFWYIVFDFDNSQWFVQSEFSTNASTNPNYIPTSGWSTSITITASSSSKISIKKQNLGGGKISLYKRFAPNALEGLSLWLKADAGTTTVAEQFISQIILTGAGTSTSNGTYTRASGGTTSFSGPNGNSITLDDTSWIVFDNTAQLDTYINYSISFSSSWSIYGGAPDAPTATTTLTPTGNTFVTAWADQSGNGNNATSPTIAPTFMPSSINSKPAISFNSDDSWMQIPQNSIGNNGNISIFIVLNYASGLCILNKGDLATFEETAWEITTTNGFGFVNNDGEESSWNVVPISLATNIPLLLEGFSSAGASQLAFNGANSGSSSGANVGFNNISQYIGIGGGGTNGQNQNNPLDARIAEIIIYDRQVTTPERQQVEAYLNEKYAIY